MEDVVRQWPRMAAMLVAQDASTGWRLGVSRARLLNGVSCLQKAIRYAQIIAIRSNAQGNAAPFVNSCLQFVQVLGCWRRLIHLAHGVAVHAEKARFQQSFCPRVWTAPSFPRFLKEQMQAVAELFARSQWHTPGVRPSESRDCMEMGKDSGSTSLPASHRFSDWLVSEEGCLHILMH